MRVLIVNYYEISKLPPVRNLVDILLKNGCIVTLVSIDKNNQYKTKQNGKFTFYKIEEEKNNIISRGINFISRKKKLRELVNDLMKNHDILWTTTDRTARDLGPVLFKYKHVMQLMELIYDIPYFPRQKIIQSNIKKYAKKAYKVVVPEYNRAQIINAWWGLEKVPIVLPNKQSVEEITDVPDDIKERLQKIENETRKIILYQGVIRKERPLDAFAEAIDELGEKYVLYIMGAKNEEVERLINTYKNVKHIDFIAPPYHLLVTQKAYIGILSYVPRKDDILHYSKLNEIYCAPNKLYEYSGYKVPMIGNDIPGLRYTIGYNAMGVIVDKFEPTYIKTAIKTIEMNYREFSQNCGEFYNMTDMDSIVMKEILDM